ncbi:MAG TPA: hypothetical protein VGP87_02940 [Gemmatimonadales bacterium]|nr:hypothetical protein [Gemmatimonadales bacterium]
MSRVARLACLGVGLYCLSIGIPCVAAQAALPAGTTVVVTLLEGVDSGRDPAGKQYRALVVKPVVAGTSVVSPGAAATVVLTHSGGGWMAQLKSVAVNGQPVAIANSAAGVLNAAQANVARGANAVNSVLKSLGQPARPTQTVAAVASGQRVILPPGTPLSFALGGSAATSGGTGAASAAAAPAASGTAAPAPSGGNATAAPAQGAAGQLNATVTETLLGPVKPAGQYVVSPDGGHLAVAGMHGSREMVTIDGVDGPDFDKAADVAHGVDRDDIAFSPDGSHSGYIAQKGDALVAVLDGKEAFTVVPTIKGGGVAGLDPYVTGKSHQVLFSPSGAHTAIATFQTGVSYMFLDGVKGPPCAEIDMRQLAFAGEKLVYAAKTADGRWHVLVDNKPGPAYDAVVNLVVSDNMLHYAFIGRTGTSSVVVADGVVGTPRPNVVAGSGLHNLVIASNGRVAYQGYAGNGPYKEQLYLGNVEVSPETTPFAGPPAVNGMAPVLYVVFSPDGSKIAYARPVPGGIAAIIDGKQSIAYDKIGQMQFGPDSKRAYFVGTKQVTGNYVVIDGQEMPMQNSVKNFVFSADGSRFGYEAYLANGGFSVVVDGKPSAKYVSLIGNALGFSADGKHSVYAGCTNYGKCQLVQDGTVKDVTGVGEFASRTRPQVLPKPVFFSPDGSQQVYIYPRSDGTGQHSVMLNGQEIGHGNTFEFPCFSPDGKHFAMIAWTGKGYAVQVDGKTGPSYDDIFEANQNVVRFLGPHTLRLLAVKGGSVYRVTLDLH